MVTTPVRMTLPSCSFAEERKITYTELRDLIQLEIKAYRDAMSLRGGKEISYREACENWNDSGERAAFITVTLPRVAK